METTEEKEKGVTPGPDPVTGLGDGQGTVTLSSS